MKILQVIPNLETGGAQKLLEYIISFLKKKNEVELVVFKRNDTEIEKAIENYGVKVHYLNISNRSPKAIFKLRQYIKKSDVVHVHLFPANYYSVFANLRIRKPLFFTEHSTHNKRRNHSWLRRLEIWIYRHFTEIICISNDTQRNLECWTKGKLMPERLTVIENGINLKIFENKDSDKSIKEIFGRGGVPLLMISRFVASKDQATLVRSLKLIDNEEVFIAFAGDGPDRQNVEKLAIELGLNDRVVFLGQRNDIPDLIQKSYIGVQSSNWEGFGLTAVEMMGGGLPVIASNVHGLDKIVEGAGLLFEKGNEYDLAQQINSLLKDNEFYKKIKVRCLNRSQNYSIEKTAERYLGLYNKAFKTSSF